MYTKNSNIFGITNAVKNPHKALITVFRMKSSTRPSASARRVEEDSLPPTLPLTPKRQPMPTVITFSLPGQMRSPQVPCSLHLSSKAFLLTPALLQV